MSESITKELREYAADYDYAMGKHVCWFADRIDARFARELQAKQDEVDGLKADNADLQAMLDASMPLPMDADGVPCHIGDTVWTKDGKSWFVDGFLRLDGDFVIYALPGDGSAVPANTVIHVDPSECLHVTPEPPDSQERIDADAKRGACEYFGHSGKSCIGCPADGGTTLASCVRRQMSDLLRRQRELDGVGETR